MEPLNALVSVTNFMLIPALAYGSQLALGALGITLIYSILRFAHFAHGDTMALGTAAVIGGTFFLQAQGVSIHPLPTALLALPFGMVVLIGYLLITDRLVYRYYRKVKAKPMIFVMASLGVMFVTNGITRLFMGVGETRFEDGERFIFSVRDFRDVTGLAEGMALRSSQAITILTALIVMVVLFWFLNRTRSGKSMRAYSDNEDLALLSGINPERVVIITWVITGMLLVTAGTLYGLDKGFRPFNYFQLLLPMFAAAILGGLGSPVGAIVGAYIVAFAEMGITYAWRRVFTYLMPEGLEPESMMQLLPVDYKFAVTFAILVIVLLFRPTGIFKGKVL
ncbi:branched-chain amino acid ABC transporter permease [Roseinatronobacter alkalisoli]|uniref:Branched-chain amino acid ABC transporter permease n=1 Tax=Roseinatronobacter alkalisoli TaxID=3028235 RepID=A0ABT5TEL3_9RHOB|nr:branched-chain amino acid ABC transporter permease [Roseinatronobacter sp. HJB301]MDD7972617.1 branched-chain amino acid ABC transporter permease [Roseinatronobacter sp. HJB301]